MRQVRVVRSGVLVATVLGMLVAPAIAQEDGTDGREHQVTRLGGSTRFSQPMRTTDDLRAMVQANRSAIRSVMMMAGYGDVSAQLVDGFSVSEVTDTTIAPGSRFLFMALKRGGAPAVLRNVRWAGRDSFDAFQFKITAGGYVYSFIVPKVCGNFSLVSKVAAPVPTAPEPPQPEPPPPPPPAYEPPPPPPPPPPQPPAVVAAVVEEKEYEPWLASFNVGNYFSASGGFENEFLDTNINRSVAFGGQIAYLWRSNVGAEFLADFAPTFKIPSLVISDHPKLSSYMFNAIYGFQFGSGWQFKPYISGGIGAINMRADLITIDTNLIQSTISASQSRFGGDVGAGFLGYLGRVGVRADIRYFRANSDTNLEGLTDRDRELLDNDTTLVELSGVRYWRSSLGVAFRW
jgi:opacity protein-like surface antigen